MITDNLKQRIENADFKFIQYIREETKSYSNKVILFSTIIILLCLKIIIIREIEFDGLKVEIKEYMLAGILTLVNIYFYLHFLNSIKIDSLIAKLPNETSSITDEISSITDEILTRSEEEIEKLNQITEKHQKLLNSGKANEKTHEDFLKEIEEISKDRTKDILLDWKETYRKLMMSHKNNKNLYIYFPNICFWTANFSFILRIIMWIRTMYYA